LLGENAFALDVKLMKPFPNRSAIGDEEILRANVSNHQTNSKNRGKPQKIDFPQIL